MVKDDIEIDAVTAWIMRVSAIKRQSHFHIENSGADHTWHESIGENIKLRVTWNWDSRSDGAIMIGEGLMILSDEIAIRETQSQYHGRISKMPDLTCNDIVDLPMFPALKITQTIYDKEIGIYLLESPIVTTYKNILEEIKAEIKAGTLPKSLKHLQKIHERAGHVG